MSILFDRFQSLSRNQKFSFVLIVSRAKFFVSLMLSEVTFCNSYIFDFIIDKEILKLTTMMQKIIYLSILVLSTLSVATGQDLVAFYTEMEVSESEEQLEIEEACSAEDEKVIFEEMKEFFAKEAAKHDFEVIITAIEKETVGGNRELSFWRRFKFYISMNWGCRGCRFENQDGRKSLRGRKLNEQLTIEEFSDEYMAYLNGHVFWSIAARAPISSEVCKATVKGFQARWVQIVELP